MSETGQPGGTKQRIETIDYAKGVGILLVVLGHVWRGLNGRVPLPQPAISAMDRWVYGFHMPLFFFVSGLFLYRSAGKPAATYLADKASTILWPYLLWSLIYWRLGALTGTTPLSPRSFGVALYSNPMGHLWFLWVLLWIAIAMLVLRKLRIPAWGTLVASIVVCIAASQGVHLRVAETSHLPIAGPLFQFAMFFPYVAAGASIAAPLLASFARLPIWVWAVLAAIGAAVVTYRAGPLADVGPVFDDARMFDFASGAAGIVMVLAFSRILERDGVTSFKFLGQRSLPIYLAHIVFAAVTRTVLVKAGHLSHWWIHLPAGFIAGVVGPVVLWQLCERFDVGWLFRFGSTPRAGRRPDASSSAGSSTGVPATLGD